MEVKFIKTPEKTIEELKQNKLITLDKACNEAILAGFFHVIDGVEYHFSFSMDAQLNFQGVRSLLADGIIPKIEWTVTRKGIYERIIINKAIMDELTIKILQHKDTNVRKLRNDLMPLVEVAQSKSDLDLIVW